MKKFIPQLLAIVLLIGAFTGSYVIEFSEMSYLDFMDHRYVLNTVVIVFALMIGYCVKNYLITVAGASLVLIIYCLAFIFEQKEVITAFLFAIFTVFIGFAALANLSRFLRDLRLNQ